MFVVLLTDFGKLHAIFACLALLIFTLKDRWMEIAFSLMVFRALLSLRCVLHPQPMQIVAISGYVELIDYTNDT